MRSVERRGRPRARAVAFGLRASLIIVAATACGRLGFDHLGPNGELGSSASGARAAGGSRDGMAGGNGAGASGGTVSIEPDASAGAVGSSGAPGGGGVDGSSRAGSAGTTAGAGAGGAAGETEAGTTVDLAAPVSRVSRTAIDQASLTWQHDVGSEQNGFLVVSVSLRAYAGVRTVDVTVDGTSPVSLGSTLFTNNAFAGLYGAVAPPNSTMVVTVTINQQTNIVAGSRLFADVDLANPVADAAGYTAIVAPGSAIVVTVPGAVAAAGTRVIDTVALAWEYPMTAGAAQTVDWNVTLPAGTELSAGASHALGTGSDITFEWAFTPQGACMVANALNPAP